MRYKPLNHLTLGVMLLAGAALAAADVPPRYLAVELDVFFDGTTVPRALNDLGMSTGSSGRGQVGIGVHAYLAHPDGSLDNIETIEAMESEGYVINNSNTIAGIMRDPLGGLYRLFYYTPQGGMIDIGSLGGSYGYVTDINEAGDVVGYWKVGSDYHAFLYTPAGGLTDLGPLEVYDSVARDINENRQVVGYGWTSTWDIHAFLWQDGVMHDLGTLGGDWSEAYYINDAGMVVGTSKDADGVLRGFRYDATTGVMELLPGPPGATMCRATWVSSDSQLYVGWWEDSVGGTAGAFYYTDSEGSVDMGLNLGIGWTARPPIVNQAGQTLLVSLDEQTYETTGYLFDPARGLFDLNELLVFEHGWRIVDTTDINETGEILCVAQTVGPPWASYAILLVPVTPGDLDADGDVDLADLAQLLAGYGMTTGATYTDGDIDSDGDVDLADLAAMLSVYGSQGG